MTASHAPSRCDKHPTTFDPSTEPPSRSREILIRPLSPSAVFESRGRQDHAPRSLLPATTEAPALVPELHPLVHVVGRFYPSDRSGVFRSPDLSQFPEGTTLDAGSSFRSVDKSRFRWSLARRQTTQCEAIVIGPCRITYFPGFPPTKTEDWGTHV